MIPLKKEKAILATTAGILSAAVLAPAAQGHDRASPVPELSPDAQAALCSVETVSGHCFAFGRTDSIIADGAAARFDVRVYTAPDWQVGGHTNQALWLGVENSAPGGAGTGWGDWCEIGWTKGYRGDVNYRQYGAFYVDGVYRDFLRYYGIVMDQSYHYQILREYDGKYNLYIDFTDVQDCYADPYTTWVRSGLEYTHPDAKAEVNDPRLLQIRDPNLVWHDWGDHGSVTQEVYGAAARWRWESFPTHGQDWTTN